MQGVVNARREAVVELRVRGPGGISLALDAVVDTGFTGALTLSAATIALLGLSPQPTAYVLLGDGSLRPVDTYEAEVEWTGGWRSVIVSEIGEGVLIGLGLLAGHQLFVEVTPGGVVDITALP